MKRPMHPIDKEILRALAGTHVKVTPSQISKAIGIHPNTALTRIKELSNKGLINCKPKGNRTYCKSANVNTLKKSLMKDFWFD